MLWGDEPKHLLGRDTVRVTVTSGSVVSTNPTSAPGTVTHPRAPATSAKATALPSTSKQRAVIPSHRLPQTADQVRNARDMEVEDVTSERQQGLEC